MVRRSNCPGKKNRMTVARRVAAYSTAAVAGAALVERAQAAPILYTPPGGPLVLQSGGGMGTNEIFVDVNNDAFNDYRIFSYFGFDINRQPRQDSSAGYNFILEFLQYLAAVVPAGETIGLASDLWSSVVGLDEFNGIRGYVGLQFDIPGGSPHFGYLDIEIDDQVQTLTVYGGAYESVANTPIQVPVPEPSSLGLLALGAAGLAAWRCRRRRGEEEVGIAGTGGAS